MEKKNVPKIRFPGFTEPWEQRKLNEFTMYSSSSLTVSDAKESGDYELYDATGSIGYTNVTAQKENYITIIKDGAGVGRVRILPKDTAFIGTMGAITPINCDIHFLFNILVQTNFNSLISGGTIPHIYYNQYGKKKYYVPKLQEQQKIGEFFKQIDNLISLHQGKLAHLKEQKKGLLQKMFPKVGAKVPEIRFPEFTGDWEQRKLKEVFISLQNNTLSRAELSDKEGIAKNVHYGDILIKFGECLDIKKYTLPLITEESIIVKYKSSFLQNGDIIVADTAEDETVGKCSEIVGLEDEIVLSGLHTIAYRPMFRFASGYLGYYMNSNLYHNQLLPLIQGIKVSSISKSAMQDTIIMYPKLIDEQAKIGELFKQLDNLISLHQRECKFYSFNSIQIKISLPNLCLCFQVLV